MAKVKHYFLICKSKVYRFWDNIIGFLILFFIIISLLSTYLLISFTLAQVTVSAGIDPIGKKTSNFFLNLVGVNIENISKSDYLSILSSITGAVAVLLTLWFSFTTTIGFYRYRSEIKKKGLIKKEIIFQDGVDDLEVMLKYYKRANSVIVFSGDFSWLDTHSKLRVEVDRLAAESKISFVSYKSEATVRNVITDQNYDKFEKNFHHIDEHKKLKCSLVQTGQSIVFLYKVDKEAEGGNKNVCIISGQEDARYLLETLENLCKEYAPR